jgi:glutathione S-transferase
MTLKLYYSPGACSLSPHIALREAGLGFDLVQVDLAAKKLEHGEDYFAINAKGYVPALGLPDGQLVTEGAVIVQYIADQKPESKLAPKAGTLSRVRLQEWLRFHRHGAAQGLWPHQ